MAKKVYTAEQKTAALAKVAEIGVTKASKELSIAIGTLNAWKKATGKTEIPAKEEAAPAKAEPADKKAAPAGKAAPAKKKAPKAAPKKTGRKSVKKAADDAKTTVKKTARKVAEKAETEAPALLSTAKQEKLIADNAVLKEENKTLKAEIVKLKKAISDLTK